MDGFPNQVFPNQSGTTHFEAILPTVYNYGEHAGDNDGSLTHFNRISPAIRGGEESYHGISNPAMDKQLCDNCSFYSDQVSYLCQENELLHQLVDNLRKRKDSHNNMNTAARKYDSVKDSSYSFGKNDGALVKFNDPISQVHAVKDENKVVINRMKSEMDFYKALNANTESVWRKKCDDLTAEKDNVIKELQVFICDNTETINRINKELETVKHAKQDLINKHTSEIFTVKSSLQKTIASLTAELEKAKAEKKESRDRIFKMVHELATTENRAQESLKAVREMTRELDKVKKESQEAINELKLIKCEENENHNSNGVNLDKLSKELAETKAQYHSQIDKLSKEIEAIQVAKSGKDLPWRKIT